MRYALSAIAIFAALPGALPACAQTAAPAGRQGPSDVGTDQPLTLESALTNTVTPGTSRYVTIEGRCTDSVFALTEEGASQLEQLTLSPREMASAFGDICVRGVKNAPLRGETLFLGIFDTAQLSETASSINAISDRPAEEVSQQLRLIRSHEEGHFWFDRFGYDYVLGVAKAPGDHDILIKRADEVFADAFGICDIAHSGASIAPARAFMAWRQRSHLAPEDAHNTAEDLSESIVYRLHTACLALPPTATRHDMAVTTAGLLFQGPWRHLIGPSR